MSKSPNNLVTKWEWPRLFRDAYQKAVTPSNITKGFDVCGIHPFDPHKIPESAFAPSAAFDGENEAPNKDISETEEMVMPPIDQSVTLATADENGVATFFQIDDAESLLELITTGKLEIVSEDSPKLEEGENQTTTSVIPVVAEHVSSPVASSSNSQLDDMSMNTLEVSWNTEIETIFDIEKSKSPTSGQKKTNRKQIKSHRLLTSDEIYLNKKMEQEEKQRLETEKEERKLQRQQKGDENEKRKMSADVKTSNKKLNVKK